MSDEDADRLTAPQREAQELDRGQPLLVHLGIVPAGGHRPAVGQHQEHLSRQVAPGPQQGRAGMLVLDLDEQGAAQVTRLAEEGVIGIQLMPDVRILAATNMNLEQTVTEGRFWTDLYYRLNVFPLHLPALRDRREDLRLLAEDFLYRRAQRTGLGPWRLSERGAGRLQAHPWTGNIRELINVLERATILAPERELDLDDVLSETRTQAGSSRPEPGSGAVLHSSLRAIERQAILQALEASRGKLYGTGGAAERLGMKPTTLQSRMKKLGIARVEGYR
jgi:DNA-binding NtrC family response regulator